MIKHGFFYVCIMNVKDIRIDLCQQLNKIIKAKGISIDELSSGTGLKPYNLTRILAGQYSADLDDILRIAQAAGITVTLQ